MKRVLVGHRGVGKTSLLNRHAKYFPGVPHFDLDSEIEKKIQSSISDFFKMFPEEKFRAAELEVFKQLVAKYPSHVISVGAGFPVAQILAASDVIFVSRPSDLDGRIFLNRPRLEQKLAPLIEFEERFHQRDAAFRFEATFIYHLADGIETSNATEEEILTFNFQISDAFYTLRSKEVAQIDRRVKNFLKIELRTDLLSESEIRHCIKTYPHHGWLISIRDQRDVDYANLGDMDCDIRFYKGQPAQILSTHTEDIEVALKEVEPHQNQFHIKLCPVVENFEDLRKGHTWQQRDPSRRSFLPRSTSGNWNWYRLHCKYIQRINFIRGFNDQLDQPTVYQWLTLPKHQPQEWAAVIGSPVHLSRSPVKHESFFSKKQAYMCAIRLYAAEFKENIDWLNQIGLAYLAVTSPLKEIAYQLSTVSSDRAEELKSVNTLKVDGNTLSGHNTDMGGFLYLIAKLNIAHSRDVAVWGGGGTLQMLRRALPKAKFFSSQSGQIREASMDEEKTFSTVIWAAPRSPQTVLPPKEWPVTKVIDLNYVENSMGLEYAQKMISNGHDVQYISGLDMFNEQARQQQAFWSAT